ncbi:hypothetical protein [Amycolatopsis sp. NPDC051128]|uniref:hypothetical protein n=1 Tax=Amycolatopsis sp. NPDC051128 TaxID=3155412 RepID=UPI003424C2CE
MDIGEPPPDPFAGMAPGERKRAQEVAILRMAYDLSSFHSIIPRERPDFALTRRAGGRPFGVEITQLFIHESQARFNLVHGYAHRLWSGGSHLHKRDVNILKSVTVEITDKHGNLRQANVPAIIMESPTVADFRSSLCGVIRSKAARRYDSDGFSHLNLVILDWFELKFDATEYLTDQFFDQEVRSALKESPFREVLLIIYNTAGSKDADPNEPAKPDARIIPLQQLLAMERFYVTGGVIDRECDGILGDVAELNRLAIDHVTRVQGYGEAVECEGRPFLRYRGTLIELGEQGMQVRETGDYEMPSYPTIAIPDRMESEVEERVTAAVEASVLGFGFARPANRPSIWSES